MSLQEIDFDAIERWVSHTSKADPKCHPLIKMTPERIRQIMSKPAIYQSYRRRIWEKMNRVRNMIEWNNSIRDIHMEFSSEVNRVDPPFRKVNSLIFNRSVKSLDFRRNPSPTLLANFQREDSILRLKEYNQFCWSWAARICTMNGLGSGIIEENNPKKIAAYIRYMQVISNMVCREWGNPITFCHITFEFLETHAAAMRELFPNDQLLWDFSPPEWSDLWQNCRIEKEIFETIITLFPCNIPSQGNFKKIYLKASDNFIEITGEIPASQMKAEYWIIKPGDLCEYPFSHSVEWSFFLQWLVDTFPQEVKFEVQWTMMVFSIKRHDKKRG